MARVRASNKGLEDVFNHILSEIERLGGSSRVTLGRGLTSPHNDNNEMLLEADGGSGGGGSCKKWVPLIKSVGDGNDKALVIKTGAINDTRPRNAGQEVTFSESEDPRYILLKVEASDTGNLTEATILVEKENLAGTQEDSQGAPPPSFHVLLGVIVRSTSTMMVCSSLSATPVETRRTAKEVKKVGQEPFDRWYRWQVREHLYEV
jgi:hypothetical protein